MWASQDRLYPRLWWNVSDLTGDGHNGDLNVTGTHLWTSVLRPEENSLPSEWMGLSQSAIFKLDSISLHSPLLSFGPHMSFISVCRNCETFTTMDSDRFHELNFTVALGGGRGGGQCSPSADCDCTRHFHKRPPSCHCWQSHANPDICTRDAYFIWYMSVLELEVKRFTAFLF